HLRCSRRTTSDAPISGRISLERHIVDPAAAARVRGRARHDLWAARARLHDGLWRALHDQLRAWRGLYDRRLYRLGRARRPARRQGRWAEPNLGPTVDAGA